MLHTTGASDIATAGWIHWTLWLLATLAQAGFWSAQGMMMLSNRTATETGTTLALFAGAGSLTHILGWIAFIAAVSSAQRRARPAARDIFG
jgi:hypothetical protein